MMASWESLVCDGVVQELFTQLTARPGPWDECAITPSPPDVIRDLENLRLASPLWCDIIDSSPEWACIRLARLDFQNENGVAWEAYEPFVMNRFFQTWDTICKSWRMATPIASRCLQLDPLGWLSDTELETLRGLLWDPMNEKIVVENGSVLRNAPDIWVSHLHRG